MRAAFFCAKNTVLILRKETVSMLYRKFSPPGLQIVRCGEKIFIIIQRVLLVFLPRSGFFLTAGRKIKTKRFLRCCKSFISVQIQQNFSPPNIDFTCRGENSEIRIIKTSTKILPQTVYFIVQGRI